MQAMGARAPQMPQDLRFVLAGEEGRGARVDYSYVPLAADSKNPTFKSKPVRADCVM
jgi:hypothetical protein